MIEQRSQPGSIAGYRTGENSSGGSGTILRPAL